jgi:uroporphyrinogen-III decarboxylase
MINERMTPKERWLAALNLQPVDRLPFWPKLNASYPLMRSGAFAEMSLRELHDWIGSDKHEHVPGIFREVHEKASSEVVNTDNERHFVFRTPYGETRRVNRFDVHSQAYHPVEFPVKTLEDIQLMTAYFEDTRAELDPEALERARAQAAEIGQDAVTATTIGESPLMYWVEWLAGIENAHYLLMDYPDEVEALFEAMHKLLLRKTALTAEYSPADLLYFSENTSTTLISPTQYRKYCFRHISEYGAITRAAGRTLVLHMCGHLKAILPDLAQVPAQGFEAFTSPTVGNTRLIDGRTECPDVCLIGGTNAVTWIKDADAIIEEIAEDLGDLPHHRGIAVTSAGVMPPLCEPETIKAVCDWVKAYPARV